MASKDSRIDAYIENAKPFAKPILKRFRKAVHAGCPAVQETIKWSFPHFEYKGMLCSIAAFNAHCAFGFAKGELMKEVPKGNRTAMGQFGRVESIDELPDEAALVRMVKEAAALNDAGTKVPRPARSPKPRLTAPDDMIAALKKNKKALSSFEAFSPSQQREYIEWIVEAKTQGTRERRLDTAVVWMAEGKIRNWKYVRS
jgi:hypothetical protein